MTSSDRTSSRTTLGDAYHRIDPARPRNAAFTVDEFRHRVAATQQAMVRAGMDVLLVHTPENIYYLTGYETSGYFEYQTLVVPAQGDPELLIRNVERINVDEYSWLPGAHIWRDGTDYVAVTAALVKQLLPTGRVGLERHSWFVTAQIADALTQSLNGHQLVSSHRLIERLRLVKSTTELDYIRQAADLADIAMAAAVDAVAEGGNELEVAAAAHAAQIRAGSEYPALPHYVSSGYRLDLGHAHWTDTTLNTGDVLKLEFLGVKRRYHAGLTRPVSVGPPSNQLRDEAALAVALQDETFDQLRPGASVDAITRDARDRLAASGRPAMKIRLGYSMGIGFPPIAGEGQTADFREDADWELQSGMVFHMLSVLRVGLVVSDTVVVTDTGYQRLTHAPRQLISV